MQILVRQPPIISNPIYFHEMNLYQLINLNKKYKNEPSGSNILGQTPKSLSWMAIASVILSAQLSNAATVPNPTDGDLFLAFRADLAPGAQTSYLVKVANVSTLKAVPVGGR